MNLEEAMDADDVVSLWLGAAAARSLFDEALDVVFSEDGDFLGSPFSSAFGIGCCDDGSRVAPGLPAQNWFLAGYGLEDFFVRFAGEATRSRTMTQLASVDLVMQGRARDR
jgi:hypothetical protein